MDEATDLVVNDLDLTTTLSAVTGGLRWNSGQLEQAWQVTRYRGGCPVRSYIEWREVPDAEPHPTGA